MNLIIDRGNEPMTHDIFWPEYSEEHEISCFARKCDYSLLDRYDDGSYDDDIPGFLGFDLNN